MSEAFFLIHQSCKRRSQSGLADLLQDIYVTSPHILLFVLQHINVGLIGMIPIFNLVGIAKGFRLEQFACGKSQNHLDKSVDSLQLQSTDRRI